MCLTSLQSRRNFGERMHSIFLTKLWPPSLILRQQKAGEGKEFVPRGRSTVKKEGQINDRELVTFAHPNKTPALQAIR